MDSFRLQHPDLSKIEANPEDLHLVWPLRKTLHSLGPEPSRKVARTGPFVAAFREVVAALTGRVNEDLPSVNCPLLRKSVVLAVKDHIGHDGGVRQRARCRVQVDAIHDALRYAGQPRR